MPGALSEFADKDDPFGLDSRMPLGDAEEILRKVPPPDDAGAETADRYEWQAMMAAADVLGIYFEQLDETGAVVAGGQFTIFCEHHEDWSFATGDGTEIISGKHREASVGALSSFRQLLMDGGVLHLFDRWTALQRTPTCRLVTTAGLASDAAKTAAVCDLLRADPASNHPSVEEVLAGLCAAIVALRSDGDGDDLANDDLRAFLTALRLQPGEARRDQVPHLAGERYGRPVAELFGQPDGGNAVWRAVLALIRPRMRDAGPRRGGALPVVLGVEHDEALASRTLTLEDVDTAVRFAVRNISGYAPLPRVIKANKMAVKMTHGGCSDNSVERADALRLQYRRYWRARRGNPNTSDQRRRLDNALSRIVDEATGAVRVDGGQWGAQLWRELGTRLRLMEGTAEVGGLDADLLLGGVSELANNCRAWYTDRFDAPTVLARLLEQEAAS